MTVASLSLLCLYVATGGYVCSFALFIFKKRYAAELCFICGILFHTVSQISRGWLIGIFIPFGIVEGVFFLPWCLAFLMLGLRLSQKEKNLGYTVLIPLLFFLFVALIYPKGALPPSPQGQTVFSSLFFFFEVLAHACFIMGAWYALSYLLGNDDTRFFQSFIIWGFIFYSIAQVTGAIWSYLGWGSLFNWSQRHLLSAGIWCFYAAYLHLRFLPAWDIRKKAAYSIAGFALVLLFICLGNLREVSMPRLGV
jgi:hypothetical protein